jgi:hypothetical protein
MGHPKKAPKDVDSRLVDHAEGYEDYFDKELDAVVYTSYGSFKEKPHTVLHHVQPLNVVEDD